MKGVKIVDIKIGSKRLEVDWIYSGVLDLEPMKIIVDPVSTDKVDILNLICSVFIPLLTAVEESVDLGMEISEDSLAFWDKLIHSLRGQYKNLSDTWARIDSPVGNYQYLREERFKDKEKWRKGIFWGGGADSSTVAVKFQEEKPFLAHIQRIEAGWKKGGAFIKALQGMADALKTDYGIVETNILEVQRRLWAPASKYINLESFWNWGTMLGPHHNRTAGNFTQGIPYLFAVLGILPPEIKTMYMAAATDDPWEPFGYGWNFWEKHPYRGITVEGVCFLSKVEEYEFLWLSGEAYKAKNHVKPCWSDNQHWCGACKKCREAALMFAANQLDPPFPLKPQKATDKPKAVGVVKAGRLMNTLFHYRKRIRKRDVEVEGEITRAIYNTLGVFEKRMEK